MPGVVPADFGLTERTIDEIRARDRRQARVFEQILTYGLGALWLTLTALVYRHAMPRAPFLGLLMAPVLGAIGAVIGAPPIAVLGALVSWLACPRHPMARALEKYEAVAATIRSCDVCRLTRDDPSLKEGVTWCGRCAAWICPACRQRYDRRVIAALKRAHGRHGAAS
jgi:hypothetical protein